MIQTPDTHILHQQRRAGILLHPTSLPGPFPRGIICHDAYRFVEFLDQAGMSVWQMLPLGICHSDLSPYQALSAHACEPSMISLDWLRDRNLLNDSIDEFTFERHHHLLKIAWAQLQTKKTSTLYKKFRKFIEQHAYWLDDFALFMAIRDHNDQAPWYEWPINIREREASALDIAKKNYKEEINFHSFLQFIFFQQWHDFKQYASDHGILLFGDLPIYVALDSADVWAHRELFMLNEDGQPRYVAGVPPDYFSETGQRWGNPQYDWAAMQTDQFKWWQQRLQTQLELFDVIRVDHFRGFEAYWEIDAKAETAIDGKWIEAPGEALLQTLSDRFHSLPLAAEDLGTITEKVTKLREQFHLPGMKVLQFAFDGDPKNFYLPPHHEFNSVVYTGTHDNDTTLSWYEQLDQHTQEYIYNYLGCNPNEAMPWPLIRAALASVSCLAMLPMQDVLGLGQGQRMNTPGTTEGNWQWRFSWDQVNPNLASSLSSLCKQYNR